MSGDLYTELATVRIKTSSMRCTAHVKVGEKLSYLAAPTFEELLAKLTDYLRYLNERAEGYHWQDFATECPHRCATKGGYCGLLCGGYCISSECRVPQDTNLLCREENCPAIEGEADNDQA